MFPAAEVSPTSLELSREAQETAVLPWLLSQMMEMRRELTLEVAQVNMANEVERYDATRKQGRVDVINALLEMVGDLSTTEKVNEDGE